MTSNDQRFKRAQVTREIKNKTQELFNEDNSEIKILLTRFNGRNGIVRCSHLAKEKTIKTLKAIDQIASVPVKIETVGTSGTIKSLMKKHMKNLLKNNTR